MVIGIASLSAAFNIFLARKLPLVDGCILVLHVMGFFAIVVSLWVLAPRKSATEVFGEWRNGGWPSGVLSVLVGAVSPYVSDWSPVARTWMNGNPAAPTGEACMPDRSPAQKQIVSSMMNPMLPFVAMVHSMARGTTNEASCTSWWG